MQRPRVLSPQFHSAAPAAAAAASAAAAAAAAACRGRAFRGRFRHSLHSLRAVLVACLAHGLTLDDSECSESTHALAAEAISGKGGATVRRFAAEASKEIGVLRST